MPELRAMIRDGMLAAVAGELLRSFRNDVAHGTLDRPQPEDWGESSEYKVDLDPAILKFHHHVRLLLVLIPNIKAIRQGVKSSRMKAIRPNPVQEVTIQTFERSYYEHLVAPRGQAARGDCR